MITPLDALTLKILHSDQVILVNQKNGDQLTVNGYSPSRNMVRLEDLWYSPEDLLRDWTYLDGRPLGFGAETGLESRDELLRMGDDELMNEIARKGRPLPFGNLTFRIPQTDDVFIFNDNVTADEIRAELKTATGERRSGGMG